MMKIPFNPDKSADQKFQVLIPEQIVLTIRLYWNTRSSAWFIDVEGYTSELVGIKVVPRYPLLRNKDAVSPIFGDLIVVNLTTLKTDFSEYSALGNTWGLFWITPEEVKTWEARNGLG